MIEIIENAIQLVTTGICTIIAVQRGLIQRRREWIILALASGVFFLGDLYWELFLVLYSKTPEFSYIPYLSWYAAYLFLLLLLIEMRDKEADRSHRKILWIVPVFTAGMCIFYLQWGDWIGNIVTAVLMSFLIWRSLDGLLSLRKQKIWLYVVMLLFCLAEYGSWTASCFASYDTLAEPYYWFDILLSVMFLLFPPALRKAVDR